MAPGSGNWGCYGSPIATPTLDALASGGLLENWSAASVWHDPPVFVGIHGLG
jgi:hypothetical protein